MRMRIALTTFLLILSAAPVVAQKIDSDHDRGVDFTRYRTYAWHPDTEAPLSFPAIDSAALDQLVRSAVEKHLADRGFVKTDGEPDLLFSYFVFGRRTTDMKGEGTGPDIQRLSTGHWHPFGGNKNEVMIRKEGTLTLNAYDAGENRIIWSGVATEVVKNRKDIEKKIDSGAKKLIKRFPKK